MTKKQLIKYILNLWRLIPAFLAYKLSNNSDKIDMDIVSWNKVKGLNLSTSKCIANYLLTYKEFRNLFIYRVKDTILYKTVERLFPPCPDLFLACDNIGGGMFIQHGFSTILAAKSVGENCWLNQQVTVGYKGTASPVIGNNVKIFCGSIIIGDVNIGDNAVIGAGAVVTKNVGAGKIMVGNPAKELKKD